MQWVRGDYFLSLTLKFKQIFEGLFLYTKIETDLHGVKAIWTLSKRKDRFLKMAYNRRGSENLGYSYDPSFCEFPSFIFLFKPIIILHTAPKM